MTIRRAVIVAAAGLLGTMAVLPASAQLGLPDSATPVPDGLAPSTGAPFPKGQYGALDALPDWGGIWFVVFSPRTPGGPPRAVPKLKGKYKEKYDAWRAEVAANHGVEKKSTSNCAPPGMPGIMQIPQYPYEFLITPGRLTVNQEAWMQTRRIWADGRKHVEDPDPSYFGDSVAKWEGDTLVVDTIGVNEELQLSAGMMHSDKMHIVERIHLNPDDPDMLINEITVDDPEALEEPWKITVNYKRDRYGKLMEFQCSQNDRNPVDAEGNTVFE